MHRRTFLCATWGGLLATIPGASVGAAAPEDSPELPVVVEGLEGDAAARVAGLMRQFATKYQLPGVSLAMAREGAVRFTACLGWADRGRSERVTEGHRFRVASVSKPLTSAVIMRLVQEERLTLEDRVFAPGGQLADLVPKVIGDRSRAARRLRAVTVAHLLEHTCGGWGNRHGDPMFTPAALGMSHPELIRWTLANRPLDHDPGADFSYSNFGYCLLGRVIERVTAMGYAEAMRKWLFAPSGVESLALGGNTLAQRLPREVTYYGRDEDPYGPAMDVRRMDAHGGWVATPRDLVQLILRLDGFPGPDDLLRPATLEQMVRPSTVNPGYAKGWAVNQASNWWHSGSFNGGSAFLARIHDRHAWAVAVNTRRREPAYRQDLDHLPWEIRRAVWS